MSDKIRIKVKGLSIVTEVEDQSLLMLVDEDEKRLLTIFCDNTMRKQIEMRLSPNPVNNTFLPEVLATVITKQLGVKMEIIINDVHEGVYRAALTNKETFQQRSMRASDAILLHMACPDIPLYASYHIMIHQSVPFNKDSNGVALPFNALSSQLLQKALEKAISEEDYEVASRIRDELKNRGDL